MPSNTVNTIIGERRRSPMGSVYEATGIGPEPRLGARPERQGVLVNHVGGPDTGLAVRTGWTPLNNYGIGWETWEVVGAPAVPEPPAADWQDVAVKFHHAIESLRGYDIHLPIQVASRVLDAEGAYRVARKVAHEG